MSNEQNIFTAADLDASFESLTAAFRRAHEAIGTSTDILEPFTRWSYPSLERDSAKATGNALVMLAQARYFDAIAEQIGLLAL